MQPQKIRLRRLSPRDLEALRFIGEGYEVAQYQLQAALFEGLSPTVTSRFMQRALARNLILAERENGIGMNRLRLTNAGRDALAGSGQGVEHVFVPRRSVALKDLSHTLRINDLRVVLGAHRPRPTALLASWALQRSVAADAVPDLLAVWNATGGRRAVLACEIDLGTESLTSYFVPKLLRLASSIRESADERGLILVLVQGRRRFLQLKELTKTVGCLITIELPQETGSPGLMALRDRFEV